MRGKKGGSEFAAVKNGLIEKFELLDIIEFTLPFSQHARTVVLLKPA
jgi:hypothetical protein